MPLQYPVRRRKRYNSFRGEVGEAAENLLNRQFATESRHTKWVTDVTEFNIGASKVYLSPVLDLQDNRVISDRHRKVLDYLTPAEVLVATVAGKTAGSATIRADSGLEPRDASPGVAVGNRHTP